MNYKYLLLAILMSFGATSYVMGQKKVAAKKKAKTAINADSIEMRKLIDAAKKGDGNS